jgi:hypothetical protein
MPDSCKTCRFFKKDDDYGYCHRHAPQARIKSADRDDGYDLYVKWPTVGADDWCGEWESKNAPTGNGLTIS